MKRICLWKLLTISLLLCSLLCGCTMASFYPLANLFFELGKGTETLYLRQDYQGQGTDDFFSPGAPWTDVNGEIIQAHGGQVQYMPVPDEMGGIVMQYVWVGENKSRGHFGNCVAVYTSNDLYHWEFRGDVLRSIESREQLSQDPYFIDAYAGYTEDELDHVYQCINTGTVIERPKMLYNEKTGKYVIWFHSDDSTDQNPNYSYDVGMAGVAVSDSPFGPFRFLERHRLNQCPEGQIDCYPFSKGEARDLNLFQDNDGTAYIVYTSENNKTLYISKLNEEYTYLSTLPEAAEYGVDYVRLFPGAMREAPALAKGDNGRYYLISSSTTGWMSNQARVWSAEDILGIWKNDGNPCVGTDGNITFDTQSTCVFQAENGQWIYYGDRWNSGNLSDSRYVWLPAAFDGDMLTITWETQWKWD